MKVTTIVRTYKRVDYLKECLASISCQSYENWELIIIDDCSTDNSIKIIKEFQENDARVKLIELNEKDPIAHLNLGHIYYSHFEEDEKVRFHFQKFIELEPHSEEIASIEEILNNLN